MTPDAAPTQADLDPTDDAISAYLLACALACVYDGGTMALARRWSRDPQTVTTLRRRTGVQAGQTLTAKRTPPVQSPPRERPP